MSEYLIHKIKVIFRYAYTGKLYDFLKDDLIEKKIVVWTRKRPAPRFRDQREPMFTLHRALKLNIFE